MTGYEVVLLSVAFGVVGLVCGYYIGMMKGLMRGVNLFISIHEYIFKSIDEMPDMEDERDEE
jgi:ABC-type dipeptide/oligopeptide/nickel transport system permease subunit